MPPGRVWHIDKIPLSQTVRLFFFYPSTLPSLLDYNILSQARGYCGGWWGRPCWLPSKGQPLFCLAPALLKKYSLGVLIGMYFKMPDLLFSIETNVLGFDGITFTDKSSLVSCNTGISITCLPLISTVCHLFLVYWGHTLCSNEWRTVLLWFNPDGMIGYMVYTEALCIVKQRQWPYCWWGHK